MIDPVKELLKLMNGHTQAQMAQQLGVSQSELSFCIAGERPPSKKLLAKLGLDVKIRREYFRIKAVESGSNGGAIGERRARSGRAP